MRVRRRSFLGAAAALLAPRTVRAAPGRALEIGQVVPPFEAASVQGELISIERAAQGHRAVAVIFTSTVCPYANSFASHLRDLSLAYEPRGVLFLGVNTNSWESLGDITDSVREHGFKFPMVKDERHVIAEAFGATRTPEAFLLDSTGQLRYRGWVKSKQGSPDLQRAIDAILAGRSIRRPVTKAFGCAVDRS